ncbi:thiamine phosphate synthase [Lysobacter sp. A3-1-A15]|uniref:thiamine phosphate synthase n=1 Tax=Novilysobacter viscosus TaxID=3098602 RepID=UPI002EDBAF50
MNTRWPHRGLYAITPDDNDTVRLVERARVVIESGATWLQYRNKHADARLRARQASALRELCAAAGVPLLINDDWRLAEEVGAAGAHLGEYDGDIEAARAALGDDALLGASCYDDIGRARCAVDAGASYVAFGAFFPSPTKPLARQADVALLQSAAPLGVPRVAIGGITPDNARGLIAAGADLVAVISGVFDAADPAAAVRAYLCAFAPLPNDPRNPQGKPSEETR